MYTIQYRFYKYAVMRCEGAIKALCAREHEMHYIKPWINGLADDLSEILPEEARKEAEPIFISIEAAESNDGLLTAVRQLKDLLEDEFKAFLRIDVLFSRPQTASHLIPIYRVLEKDESVRSVCVARQYRTAIGRVLLYNAFDKLKETLDGRVNYIDYTEYSIHREMPDAVIYSEIFGVISRPARLSMMCVKAYIRRTVFVDFSFSSNDLVVSDTRNSAFLGTWLDCCISEHIWRMRHLVRRHDIKNSLITGHPLMDIAYDMYNKGIKPEVPEKWKDMIEKQRPIKIILWATGWCKIQEFNMLEDALRANPDVLIICRPHPESLRTEFSTGINLLFELDSKYDNLIIDKFSDHSYILSIADAYVGGVSTLYQQFVPSGNPGIVFLDDADYKDTYVNRWTHVKVAQSTQDILEFMLKVKSGSPMERTDEKLDRYYMGPVDGKSCNRIHDAIISKFRVEEKPFIEKYCEELMGSE